MRALSEPMIEILMECHERLLLDQEPLSTYYCRFAKGLLLRGLIEPKSVIKDGRPFEGFWITEKGIEFLNHATPS